MKTSVIRHRVADFLKQHAPFDALSDADLLLLAGSGKVRFHEADEILIQAGDPCPPLLRVIQQGRVELVEQTPAGEQLRDVLGEGDMPGIEAFVEGHCRYAARTASDVIVYSISAELFESLITAYPAVRDFLVAQVALAGDRGASWLDAEMPPLDFLRDPATADAPAAPWPLTTREALLQMVDDGVETLCLEPHGRALTAATLTLFGARPLPQLLTAIGRAESTRELALLVRRASVEIHAALGQLRDAQDCCDLTRALVSAVARRCLRLAETPPGGCWLLLGNTGNTVEPSLPLLLSIEGAPAGPAQALLAECGLADAGVVLPEGLRASMPLDEWQRYFRQTLENPLACNLQQRRALFDLQPLAGDTALLAELHHGLAAALSDSILLPLLANDALAELPPLTFVDGRVMDSDGLVHETLDIRRAALEPLIAAARVFALARGRFEALSAARRLEAVMLSEPRGARQLGEAAEAFRAVLYYRARAGADQIEPARLGKLDQLVLKTAFAAIHRFLEYAASRFIPDAA